MLSKNLSVRLSVTNFDPNYHRTGKTEWAETFLGHFWQKATSQKKFIVRKMAGSCLARDWAEFFDLSYLQNIFFRNYSVRLPERRKMYCHYTHMHVARSFLFLTTVCPPLTNFVIYPLCFLTAYKSCDILPFLAGTSDSKNPDPYY